MTSQSNAVPADSPAKTVPLESHRELQMQRILSAANTCFVRSGFQGASMQEICKQAQMSPGALYRYFPSKEAIIDAIAEADRAEDAKILSEMSKNPSVVDGFVGASLAYIRNVHETGRGPLFCEIRAESMRNDSVKHACDETMSQCKLALKQYLEEASERGEINPVVDIETMLAILLAIGEGLAVKDLPSQGIDYNQIEIVLRTAINANLRPAEVNNE